ncbi:MAG: hypothetical protein KDB82_04615 [Planctomycetes bacterium]|nr:hypothetical protein [Planctomycetota bacterium]
MERKSALLALAVLCVLAAGGVSAASFTANNVSELRAHITTSNGNTGSDTITVVAGTFTLSGAAGENSNGSGDLDIIRTGGSLVIEGAGVGQTIIDGGNVDRVFHVNMSGGATVTFRDLTIQGGSAVDNGTNGSEARGAAILNESGSDMTLESVEILTCSTSGAAGAVGTLGTPGSPPADGGPGGTGAPARGGAIYHAGGTLTLDGCVISTINASGGLGGLGGSGGINTGAGAGGDGGTGGDGGAAQGGAIYISGGTAVISDTTIDNIVAHAGRGGPGGNPGPGSPVGQVGDGGSGGAARGGAIYLSNGSLTLQRVTLYNNQAIGGDGNNGFNGGAGGSASGGDVYANTGMADFINGTFSGGTALGRTGGDSSGGGAGAPGGDATGGAFAFTGGTPTFYNCTVAEGTATGGTGGAGSSQGSTGSTQGGNVYRGGGTVTAHSTIFWGGTAAQGPDFFGALTASGCLFGNTTDTSISNGAVANKLNQNPQLGSLANNGGVLLTRLIPTNSAALNSGSNPLNLVNDTRGLWYNREHSQADIGAIEVQLGFPRPIIEDPATAVSVASTTYVIKGTAATNTLVRIYADLNNNTVIDTGESVVGTQQLTGGNHSFSITVSLSAGTANNFMATVDNTAIESEPSDVPTITETSTPPNPPVVTTPSTATNTTGGTFNIIGTADPDALVQVYIDYNNNGAIDPVDTVVSSQQLSGGGTNWNISTPLTLSTTNNFVVTAKDGTGFESTPTNVPTITETSAPLVAQPVVTDPAVAVTLDAATYTIVGTAPANSLVKIYSDSNDDGFINGSDASVAQQQLSGGAVDFSIVVTLAQDALNPFVVTATDGSMTESLPTDVPTITEQTPSGGGGGNGGGDGGGGGCTANPNARSRLLLAGLLAAMLIALRSVWRRGEL